jgi:ribose-phosphate pyrophosphokinase
MPSFINKVKIFSGTATMDLAAKIAASYGQPLGSASIPRFSDGEFQPSLNESVRGCDVFIIQSTIPPFDNLFELLLMIDAAKRASAHNVIAVIPYFGLARQDRKDQPRVPIGSKMVANILKASGADRVMTMDLHAPQIQGFFDIPVDHLDSTVIFIPYIRSLNLGDNIVLAAPDIGASKRVREFAKILRCEMVICDKARKRANEIASMTIIGDVTGKDVLLIDDICDTANTLARASQLIMDSGAKSVRAVCTHPVLSGKAYETIDNSVMEELVVTDTIPLLNKSSKIKVLSVDILFANAIRSVCEYSSISKLFSVENS